MVCIRLKTAFTQCYTPLIAEDGDSWNVMLDQRISVRKELWIRNQQINNLLPEQLSKIYQNRCRLHQWNQFGQRSTILEFLNTSLNRITVVFNIVFISFFQILSLSLASICSKYPVYLVKTMKSFHMYWYTQNIVISQHKYSEWDGSDVSVILFVESSFTLAINCKLS